MLIRYDEENEKIISKGTNSAFPDGNIPNLPELPEGLIYLKCHDDSEIAEKVMNAHDCEIEYNNDKKIIDITVNQTQKEYLENKMSDKERIEELEELLVAQLGGAE